MDNLLCKGALVFAIIFLLIQTSIPTESTSEKHINSKDVLEKISTQFLNDDSPPAEPTFIKETYMVPMRDGIHLATDVYLPSKDTSPHGCILVRTPYNKNNNPLDTWADEGWPSIVQDMRGRYASEGIDTVFRNAHTDGPDTLQWIAEQEWCNGKIATFGGSALGINQYYMAGANPPFLACQYIQVATPNLYKHAMFQGGEFRKYMVEEWLRGQQSLFVLPELLAHENYTLDYWTNTSLEDKWQEVNVPAMHVGGWYDCFAQGIVDGFMGYQYLAGRGARGQSKLVMGPWTHGGGTHQGELVYPLNAEPSFLWDMFVDMIFRYTMDEMNDFEDYPSVSYYVMSDVDTIDAPGNEWRFADAWPIPYKETPWYFQQNGDLTLTAQSDSDSFTYTYDPSNPVPTLGGQNLVLKKGPYDQRPVEQRDDVLIFTSPFLEEPYEATGPIKARLYVSSDCPDTDFTVKLTDVYPDGRSMLITDGILRMRNRNGPDHWEFMTPGEIYEIEVDLWSTSYVWNINHHIRVAISSSNYPRFLNNPNTADAIYHNTTFNIAHNTIYLDSEHLSCLLLPEIEHESSTPPSTPITPKGPTTGRFWKEYTYTTQAVDPEGDQIYVLFDWNDGTRTGWMGPYESGEPVSFSHAWTQGTYNLRVKAKDIHGAQSNWSEPLPIVIAKNRSSLQGVLEKIFECFINRYPILYSLLIKR
jgi:predicted acyl esterase